MLKARSITFSQGNRLVLDNLSLQVEPGKCLAILGPSGSGKTTLLRILSGLIAPQSGSVLWNSTELTRDTTILVPPEKRLFGMVFQDSALFPHLSVLGNVMFGIRGLPIMERKKLALDWLNKLGIEHLAEREIGALSGGEKQRVALARSLAPSPRALFLDEPFSSVDRLARLELIAVLKDVLPAAQTVTILVTHDERDAADLAHDRIVLSSHSTPSILSYSDAL